MALEITNLSSSTLDGGINNSVTTLNVVSASSFPTSGDFWIGVGAGSVAGHPAEIMKVTGVSSNTFTVVRGVSPTSGVSHSSGATVYQVIGADSFNQLRADITRQGTYSTLSGLTDMKAGDTFWFDGTDTPYHRAVYNGSSWDLYYQGYKCTPPVLGDFSWVNQGGASATTTGGAILMTAAAATDNLRLLVKTAPSTPYTVRVLMRMMYRGNTVHSGMASLWRQSSDGKFQWNYHKWTSHGTEKWSSATSFNSSYTSQTQELRESTVLWKINDDATNRITSMSYDFLTDQQIHTIGRTDFLTADQVGFGFYAPASSTPNMYVWILSWKES